MQLREHQAKLGRVDAFKVDPRAILIDRSHNIRDMHSERTRAHVDELKVSIRSEGVKKPIEVRMIGDDIFVTDGECRLTAVQELIRDEGFAISSVLCIHEPQGTTDVERVLNLGIANSGERPTPLEMAELCKRALRLGATEEQIAGAIGWKSTSSVRQHLEMLSDLSEPMKDHVRNGHIAATTARNLAKSELTPEQQEELIRSNIEENKKFGVGKRHVAKPKVKPRHVKDAVAKSKPKPEPTNGADHSDLSASSAQIETVAPEIEERVSVSETDGSGLAASAVSVDQGGVVDAALGGEYESKFRSDYLTHEIAHDMGLPAEPHAPARFQVPVSFAAPTTPMHRAIEALAIFAKHAEESCVNKRPDDYVVEIPASDLKRAWEAYRAVAGETV